MIEATNVRSADLESQIKRQLGKTSDLAGAFLLFFFLLLSVPSGAAQLSHLLPLGMTSRTYVGFDIGKFEHAYAIIGPDGSLLERETVSTDLSVLRPLVERIRTEFPRAVAICESTGYYHEPLGRECLAVGLELRIVNPVLTTTKALRRNVRSVKTDLTDAERLAIRLRETEGVFGYPFVWDERTRALHALGRSVFLLMRQRSAIDTHFRSLIERPIMNVTAPNPLLWETELERLKAELVRLATEMYPEEMRFLDDIRGIGPYLAASLLAEIGDVRRFRRSASLVAFAGMDPRVRLSGVSIHGIGRMTKSGSHILRRHVGWAAHTLVQWNPAFRTVFQNAMGRGKPGGVAYGIVARKFITVLHQVLVHRVPFDGTRVGDMAPDDAREVRPSRSADRPRRQLQGQGERFQDDDLGN